MTSKHPDAPECPKCGRSQGITTALTATAQWSRGAWRYIHEPELDFGTDEYQCPCGHFWNNNSDTWAPL